jgi:hypothetical protein
MRAVLADATADDLAVIGDSWRKSGRNTPRTHGWSDAAYYAWADLHIEQLLPRCQVLVARPPDWSEGVLAWVASEQRGDAWVLHWAYCKELFRRQGLVSQLIEAQHARGPRLYSAKSFAAGADGLVRKFGLRFAPEASNRRKAG